MISPQRLLVMTALLATGAPAQWLNFPTPGIPRTRDGKPNLSAKPPRMANGKPDLSGVWLHPPTPIAELRRLFGGVVDGASALDVPGMEIDTVSKYAINILVDLKPDEIPLLPPAAEIFHRRSSGRETRPVCLPIGIPANALVSEPNKIVQSPRMTVILYESDGSHRQIYTDGRALPKEFVQPSFLGYSAGKWEGDTLVVETGGFNDQTWLDLAGHPHSEALHLTERYRRPDFGHLDVEMTFDDPQMYPKPFTIKYSENLLADSDIFENYCEENEKDRVHSGEK
jgi:hypothetical protein